MSAQKSDVLRNLFALELNAKLTFKYKKIPSAEKIATDIFIDITCLQDFKANSVFGLKRL